MEANSSASAPSEFIFFSYRPDREKIKCQNSLENFEPDERLEFVLKLRDGKTVPDELEDLVIGDRNVSWLRGSAEPVYANDSGEIDDRDADHEVIFEIDEIAEWKAVFVSDQCYLEMETRAGEDYTSLLMPDTEGEGLIALQKVLNRVMAQLKEK